MDMEIYFPGGKKVNVDYAGYTIPTDQPIKSGGDGSAPSPFDLFLSSIGACAGIYVLSFCQARNIPTDDIRLKLEFNYSQAKRLIDQIMITIELPPTFPKEYVDAVIRSAQYCAVTKHLYDPPQIELQAKILEPVTG